ncbi:MAG TPA: RDD family protein [Pyrinomonadaceae bacterium]|nr:RDD family protein [Pyrinomonadaceae bacterium]
MEAADEASPTAAQATSTLLEFPGVSRVSRPQWRKELSERVREIQERRARETVSEAEELTLKHREQPAHAEAAAPQLGLVPQPDAPQVNPIVAAALKRLERARQPSLPTPRPRAAARRGSAATARVADEHYEAETKAVEAPPAVPAPLSVAAQSVKAEALPQPKTSEPQRERPLAVVPVAAVEKVAAPAAQAVSNPRPKATVVQKIEEAAAPVVLNEEVTNKGAVEEFYDDHAPVVSRLVGSLIDLLVVAFASSPFAAIIELTNGNWADWRVLASMGGIVLLVMFLYLTAATALAGRTWGMSLLGLRAVDADTGAPPTTKQSVGRALLYIFSLLTLGFGILYALFDAEGRTAHDYFSGTAVVRE